MSQLLLRHWTSDGTVCHEGSETSCDYEAYSPDPLLARAFRLDGDVAADVADAETAVARLNDGAAALVNSEALARMLLRAEAVASSRIEGLRVGARRLLHAEVSRRIGAGHIDITASEILRTSRQWTSGWPARRGDDITLELLLETHRRLLEGPYSRSTAVVYATRRTGSAATSSIRARRVRPPPPELVKPLLDDLLAFSNDDRLPAVVQAAIAHAQFETIHPSWTVTVESGDYSSTKSCAGAGSPFVY